VELTDISIDAFVTLAEQKQRKWCLVLKIFIKKKFLVKKKFSTIDE